MSNRRKARRSVPLDGVNGGLPASPAQSMLGLIEWSDNPAAAYPTQVLEWIAAQAPTRGRYNVWVCEDCAEDFLCYDLHPGTTPFTVAHQTLDPSSPCQGVTVSTFYNGARAEVALAKHGGPSHQWYRPSSVELRHQGRHVRDHVMQGGLLVRRVPK